MTKRRAACWCGNRTLKPYGGGYLHCSKCESLVLAQAPSNLTPRITDEEADLYGRNYYLKHLTNDYGYPDLQERARSDIGERCIHWLKTLLQFKPNGARVLEIGCGHGGSVALFRTAGYDATGLELSPWLVQFAQETWDIPVLTGPLDDQTIDQKSLDVVAMFDVIEHLTDPIQILRHCHSLLAPNGVIIIQTPRFPEKATCEELQARSDPFLVHLKPAEHIHLFSRKALVQALQTAGFQSHSFQEPMFPHYDQYLVASPGSRIRRRRNWEKSALDSDRNARIVRALVDLSDRNRGLTETIHERDEQLAKLDDELKKVNTLARIQSDKDQQRLSELDAELQAASQGALRIRSFVEAALRDSDHLAGHKNQTQRKPGRSSASLSETLGKLEEELAALHTHSQEASVAAAERASRLERELSDARKTEEMLVLEIQSSHKRIAEIDEDRARANAAAASQADELHGQLLAVEKAREALTSEVRFAHLRMDELDKELAQAHASAARSTSEWAEGFAKSEEARLLLESHLRDSHERLAEVDRELTNANMAAAKEIESLNARLVGAETNRSTLECQLREAQQRMADLNEMLEDANAYAQRQIEEMDTRLENCEHNRENAESDLREASRRIAELDSRAHDANLAAQKHIDAFQVQQDEFEHFRRDFERLLHESGARLTKMDSEIQAVNTVAREQIAALHSRLQASDHTRTKVEGDLQQARARMATLDRELVDVNQIAREQANQACRELETVNIKLVAAGAETDARNKELARIKLKLDQLASAAWTRFGIRLGVVPGSRTDQDE